MDGNVKSVEEVLYEEALSECSAMAGMKLGSEEHTKTAKVVNDMMDRLIKLEEVKNEQRRLDIEEQKAYIEERKVDSDKINQWIRNGITLVTFGVSVMVTVWANEDSKLFEQGYTHTTEAGRTSTRRLLTLLDKFKI